MLTSDFLPNIGGIASHIFYLSQAMISLGHRVTVVHVVERDGQPSLRQTQVSGVPVVEVAHRCPRTVVGRQVAFIRAAREGMYLARELLGHVDVIHQHDNRPSFLPDVRRWRGKNESLRWIWTNHSSWFLKAYRSVMLRQVVRLLHGSVDGIITVSSEIHEKTRRLFPQIPATFIPNGVDTSVFNPDRDVDREELGLDRDAFVVLCPRRMVPKNGVIYLAQAVEKVMRRLPDENIQFVFLGDAPARNTDSAYVRRVKALLAPFQRAGRVVFLGNVPWHKMPDVNAVADLVVIPSLIEAVSLSALEAMATGKAVVATKIGGLRDVIRHGENGILVEPASPGELADAIVDLYMNGSLRTQIGQRGLQTALSGFTWDSIARRTVDFYERCRALV